MITITIGRNDQNSMQISEDFRRVSRNHGKIDAWETGEMKFTDFSTYGTTINGTFVQNDTVDIKIGDEIILGGECTLNWGIIEKFLPQIQNPKGGKETVVFYGGDEPKNDDNDAQNGRETVFDNTKKGGKETVIKGGKGKKTKLYHTTGDVVEHKETASSNTSSESIRSRSGYWSHKEVNSFLKKWNWGAFFLSFVWGCFHKIYWPLYILAANLVVSVLPFLMKGEDLILAVAIITWIVHLAVFVASVYLGINGSEMAWKLDVCNKDLGEFKKKEKRWATAGFITFCVGMSAVIVAVILLIDKI